MGRLTRWLAASALAVGLALLGADATLGFDGFADLDADSTYAEEIRLTVGLDGGVPDRLELLVWTPGDESATVLPVEAAGTSVTYVWNTSVNHVTPNTLITYRWRAVEGDAVILSEEATIRYEDDRPGLDWQSAQLGEATVHWYGGAESTARRFGELTAQGVERAEDLLGTELAGPVDIFVYDSRDEFFGALGPGVREWTGAAAYSELRTIFMWLGGGSPEYLEVAMLHEVTHIVFHDATENPFHEPARWLNEGIATWSETSEGADERGIVQIEATGGGLFAFEAITEQFPIGERGGRLSYAQGTTMVDMIVDRYGEEAIAAIAAAYRGGASDADALEAGTGVPAEQLYADFYEAFGVDPPQPIAVEPIPPSNVDRPPAGETDQGGVDPDAEPATPRPPDDGAPAEGGGDDDASSIGLVALLVAGAAAALAAVWMVSRRAARREGG
ncbi:MAG TPA: peptidase MA family metallohydrolase [Candidatus Limnocylindria bacterium]|nr:peptidase MA family metallohydrolase [Candidatus Limnocylindria bacterium]